MASDTSTKVIKQIKEILDEVTSNPDDYDLTKTAVEIFELILASLPHYGSWAHQRNILARSDKIGGLK